MSTQFIVRFRGQPVRFTFAAGKSFYEIVPRSMANIFTSEDEAERVATQHQMNWEHLEVCPLSAVPTEQEAA